MPRDYRSSLLYEGELRRNNVTVWVGNLPYDVKAYEMRELFERFGEVKNVDIDNSRRSRDVMCYVTFVSKTEADRAIKARNGVQFGGRRIRVEIAHASRRLQINYAEPSRNRVWVRNIPEGTAWQDLKDFFREYGNIRHTNVLFNRYGVVEFVKESDVDRAIDGAHNREFTGRSGAKSVVKCGSNIPRDVLELDRDHRDRSRSRTPVRRRRSRSRSESASPKRKEKKNCEEYTID